MAIFNNSYNSYSSLNEVKDFLTTESSLTHHSLLAIINSCKDKISEEILNLGNTNLDKVKELKNRIVFFDNITLKTLIDQGLIIEKEIEDMEKVSENQSNDKKIELLFNKCRKIIEFNELLEKIQQQKQQLGKIIDLSAKNFEMGLPDFKKHLEKVLPMKINMDETLKTLTKCYRYVIHSWNSNTKAKEFVLNFKKSIKDETVIFQFLKFFAEVANYSSDLLEIPLWDVQDETQRFEIAKIAFSKSLKDGCSYIIKEFNLNLSHRIEVAKIAIIENLVSIKEYMINDKAKLLEIANIGADLGRVSMIIQDCLITDQNVLYELAKRDLLANHGRTAFYIDRFGITDGKNLFELAKICARQSVCIISTCLENFGIQDENDRYEIAKICAVRDAHNTLWFLKNYDLKDPSMLLKIAKIALEQNYLDLDLYIAVFDIVDEGKPFDILVRAGEQIGIPLESLNWFRAFISKLDNPEQKKANIKWFGEILTSCASDSSITKIFEDKEDAFRTLTIIASVTNSLVKKEATTALLYYYKPGNEKALWKQIAPNILKKAAHRTLTDHLLLISLFLKYRNVDINKIESIVTNLNNTYYKNRDIINQILEMFALFKNFNNSFSNTERNNFLDLVFQFPTKMNKERNIDFEKRLGADRDKQKQCVSAVRDLILVGKDDVLKKTTNRDELLDQWKETFQAFFGIKAGAEVMTKFFDTFRNSKRYPGGLFNYAARLSTLPEFEQKTIIQSLGKYVSAVLDGTYPEMRYDLSCNNVHLNTLLSESSGLLSKWKETMSFNATDHLNKTDSVKSVQETPQALVSRLLKQALLENHLGNDQGKLFPNLSDALKDWNEWRAVNAKIKILEIDHTKLKIKIKETSKNTDPEFTKICDDLDKQLKRLTIETICLSLLDPQNNLSKLIERLSALKSLLPKESQFTKDVEGILQQLKPSEVSYAKWIVQDTDQWEDMLLMGTEVTNSCLNIEGDPHFNKCLLAYILDGKNKPVVVKDNDGKIVARAVLRLLWDEILKQPVLFLERTYTRKNDSALLALIREGAMRKAKNLNITLVASSKDYPDAAHLKLYANQLKALGGPAPFEYVDALRGIQTDGKFTIQHSFILNERIGLSVSAN